MSSAKSQATPKSIKLLIVDDSWILRRVLRGTLSQRDDIEIVGEATNGIEALDLVLKLSPDVILLDVEMPTMDGMITLQHLMIQTPTPVIMLSGLSKSGTPRCFDALKYGAVDFVSKDSFFKGIDGTAHTKLVIDKILAAAAMSVSSIDIMQENSGPKLGKKHEKVVFCEECGTSNTTIVSPSGAYTIQCRKCGDDISSVEDKRYMRMDYLTVIGTGASGYGNLLKIIPDFPPDMAGAIFVMIQDTVAHVKSFGKYLDSMCDFQVAFGENGTTVESGFCYLFSAQQDVTLSPYSGQYSLQIDMDDSVPEPGAVDKLMGSVASVLGERVSGVLLSGEGSDGSLGMQAIMENNGNCMVLNPEFCLLKNMVSRPLIDLDLAPDLDESSIALQIKTNHFHNKENVITA